MLLSKQKMRQIEEGYIKLTKKSKQLFEEALSIMPDGVGGDGKYSWPYPAYLAGAKGAKIYDIDGNEYIDYMMGAGAIILGHNHPKIIEGAKKQMDQCFTYGANEIEVKYAQKIRQHVPSMERIRFLPSGTEANLAAIRVARAFTKRKKIAKFEGAYHGQHDYLLISVNAEQGRRGSTSEPFKNRACAGIPDEVLDLTLILPFNDTEKAVSLIKREASNLALVMVEPVLGFGGGIPAEPEFLKAIRDVTAENDILLSFDEVITGFRLGLNGAQGYYGITPDLTVIGKIIAGGFPIGALGGREEIMEILSKSTGATPDSTVFQSGTFSGHAVSCAAGMAAMEELERVDIYKPMNELGDMLRSGLTEVFTGEGFDVQVTGIGSIFMPHFTKKPVRDVRGAIDADREKLIEYHMGMFERGIYMFQGHLSIMCAAHTKEDIEKTLGASQEVLRKMEKGK